MITYEKATISDIECIYKLCKGLIDDYENIGSIDYDKVLKWVHQKIESSIDEYSVIFVSGEKAGYYHFYLNSDGEYELDDLYIFPKYQNRGIGTEIIKRCCSSVNTSVLLYVFINNKKAVELYKRLGFEIVQTVNYTRYLMRKRKMTITDIAKKLGLTQHTEFSGSEVTGVYCCDLLSNALIKLSAGQLFITVMNNPNTIAVAFAKSASAVVLPEGIKPDPALLEAAEQHKICVLTTEMSAFELCCKLSAMF